MYIYKTFISELSCLRNAFRPIHFRGLRRARRESRVKKPLARDFSETQTLYIRITSRCCQPDKTAFENHQQPPAMKQSRKSGRERGDEIVIPPTAVCVSLKKKNKTPAAASRSLSLSMKHISRRHARARARKRVFHFHKHVHNTFARVVDSTGRRWMNRPCT